MIPSPTSHQLKDIIIEGYATVEQIRWYRYTIEYHNFPLNITSKHVMQYFSHMDNLMLYQALELLTSIYRRTEIEMINEERNQLDECLKNDDATIVSLAIKCYVEHYLKNPDLSR
jgi:hypothetical protein